MFLNWRVMCDCDPGYIITVFAAIFFLYGAIFERRKACYLDTGVTVMDLVKWWKKSIRRGLKGGWRFGM